MTAARREHRGARLPGEPLREGGDAALASVAGATWSPSISTALRHRAVHPARSDLDLIVLVSDGLDSRRPASWSPRYAPCDGKVVKGLDLWCFPTPRPRRPRATRRLLPPGSSPRSTARYQRPQRPGRRPARACCCSMCHQHAIALPDRSPGVGDRAGRRCLVVDAMRGRPRAHRRGRGGNRVFNACRTLHYSRRAGSAPGATAPRWARGRCPISDLSTTPSLARERHRAGDGPRPGRGVRRAGGGAAGRAVADRRPAGVPVAEAAAAWSPCSTRSRWSAACCGRPTARSCWRSRPGASRPALVAARAHRPRAGRRRDTARAAGSRPGTERGRAAQRTPTSGRPMPWPRPRVR